MIYALVLSLAILSAYYLLMFSRLAFYKVSGDTNGNQSHNTSIVICYHNEEQKIDKYLPHIINQKVEEIVLVDDNSTDETLKKLKKYHSGHVKVMAIEESTRGKKNALSQGIKAAGNDSILLTDADCRPASEHWAEHMMEKPHAFVLGYGPMNKLEGVAALFSRFETYMTALQYLSYALSGIPYMGVGRNMKIDRKTLLTNKAQIKGTNLASGDDDLMINALANRDNTGICIHPESFVYSDPKTTLSAFLRQKSRHISTSAYYKPHHKLLLVLFSGIQIAFYMILIIGLIAGMISVKLGLILLLIKWLIQQVINYPVMKKLKESDLFWKFPVLDILFFVYLLTMPVYYLFNKNTTRWS